MNDKPILSPEEIQEILLDAEDLGSLEEFHDITQQPSSWKSVYCLSPIHKLIFIKGNNDIGFEHIRIRHTGYFQNTYAAGKGFRPSGKIDTPGHFKKGAVPFGDYKVIADQLFTSGTKDNRGGCDSFTGLCAHDDGTEVEYCLVFIENTKIIVTLYPTKTTENIKKPKDFPWHRAKVKSFDFIDSTGKRIIQIWIPYFNKDMKLEYNIFVKYLMEEKIEQVTIAVSNEQGVPYINLVNQHQNPIISQRPFSELPPIEILEQMFQDCEMDNYENIFFIYHKQLHKQ